MDLNDINDNNFDAQIEQCSSSSLVFFWAPWSTPCQPFKTTLEELAETYDGKLEIHCMNVDENANMPASLGIKVIPQVSLIKNGVVHESLSGRQPKVKIREFLEKVVQNEQGQP